jgi:hypothetical protein
MESDKLKIIKPKWRWWQKLIAKILLPKSYYMRWRDYGVSK